MTPAIYVAGASKELGRVKEAIAMLDKEGFRVTYDWTKAVEKFGTMGESLTDSSLRLYARADLRGIDDADIVWLLSPRPGATSVGMWIEMGYALSAYSALSEGVRLSASGPGFKQHGRRIVVSPPVSDRSIFAKLPVVVERESDEAAFEWIQQFPG